MKKPFRALLFCGVLCLLLALVFTASADDLPTNYAKALKYVKKKPAHGSRCDEHRLESEAAD